MENNILLVNINIDRLPLQYEIEEKIEGFSFPITKDVYVLPKDIRENLEKFEEKVIREFFNTTQLTVFKQEKWFEDIKESLKYSRSVNEGIPSLIMPSRVYEKFLVKFNHYRDEFMQLKMEIVSQYDQIVESFNEGFIKYFPDVKDILNTIPTKEECEKSFKIGIHALKYKDLQEELNTEGVSK